MSFFPDSGKTIRNNEYAPKTSKKKVDIQGSILRYRFSKPTGVSLKVYDIKDRLINLLILGTQLAGVYSLHLSKSRLASGHYLLDFTAGDFRVLQSVTIGE